MPSFTNRSAEKELLDRNDIPFEDIRQNMKELDVINQKLGGHHVSLKGFAELLKDYKSKQHLHVVEIGCGGGSNLRALKKYAASENINIELTGIDINPECIQYAKSLDENKGIGFICADYLDYKFEENPSIIFSSLFCHHFPDQELVYMLKWMKANTKIGFFINDLHRHPVAYYAIAVLTKLFSKSYLVKNDAPVSVKRGFIKKDWEKLLSAADIKNGRIHWCWAFRWLLTCRNHD